MTERRKRGLYGEMAAARYLRDEGYEILAANYRVRAGEIDLVAGDGAFVCFVEVKTRDPDAFFDPAEAVDAGKAKRVRAAAAAFLAATGLALPARYDIMEVTASPDGYACKYIKNAF